MFLIVLLYALLASSFVFAKYALDYAAPIFLIGFRMTLSGVLLLGYLYFFRKDAFRLKKEDLFLFFRVAFFHIYLAFITEFWALQYVTSSKTTLIYSLTPFIAATLAYFLLKEKLNTRKVIGMCVGVLGLCPILFQTQSEGGEKFFSISIPEIVLLVAVVSASYAWFDIKKLMAKNYSLLMINGFAMFTGGVAAFLTSFATEGFTPAPVTEFGPFLKYVLILVILSNVIFYNMYGWLLKKYSITFLTFAGFLSPIFGTFFGWFFRNDPITWHYWLSLGLITLALFIFYREEIKQIIPKNGAQLA